MTNREATKRFDQCHGVMINQLFWIAGSIENSDFKELIDYMGDKAWENLFPEIFNSKHFKHYKKDDELIQALIDFDRFGLIAEIHLPDCDNFRYKEDGRPCSWSLHRGSCRIEYAYGETMDELLEAIEKRSAEVFQQYVAKDKKKRDASAQLAS